MSDPTQLTLAQARDAIRSEALSAVELTRAHIDAVAQGEKGASDPVEMYLNDVFTVTANMAGLPGVSAPGGLAANGLPLGLQLIGRPFDEATLFSLAAAIERAAPRIDSPSPWWRAPGGTRAK